MVESSVLTLNHVSKQFRRSPACAISNLSLDLQKGDLLSLLGPSGCGKTTLLRMIAGFEKPSQGTITIAGQVVADGFRWIPPERRDVGMVFQDYALFPHLTIAENIAFGLKNHPRRRLSSQHVISTVRDCLDRVKLTGLEHRYPHELSGGQQQRVALARALAPQPNLILLDEPLSNLDAQVRLQLREEVRHILKNSQISAIFVTHDQEEALSLSDRIAVLRHGQLEQVGTPEEIYQAPATQFVAEFVSQVNCIVVQRRGDHWHSELGAFPAFPKQDFSQGMMMIRPEELHLRPNPDGLFRICDRQFLGREHRYCLISPSGQELHVRTATQELFDVNSWVTAEYRGKTIQVFPKSSVGSSDVVGD